MSETITLQERSSKAVTIFGGTLPQATPVTDTMVEWAVATFGRRAVRSVGFSIEISKAAFVRSGLALGAQAI